MDVVLNCLIGLAGLAMLVCAIMVLVKLFQQEGAMKGIIGIVTCSIYAYIWGWMNIKKEELKLKNWMYGWTAAFVLYIILIIASVIIAQVLNNVASGLGG